MVIKFEFLFFHSLTQKRAKLEKQELEQGMARRPQQQRWGFVTASSGQQEFGQIFKSVVFCCSGIFLWNDAHDKTVEDICSVHHLC